MKNQFWKDLKIFWGFFLIKKAIKSIKEITLPFFGNIEGVLLKIKEVDEKNKEIIVLLDFPKELEFLKELVLFELRTIEKHYKKKIVVKDWLINLCNQK